MSGQGRPKGIWNYPHQSGYSNHHSHNHQNYPNFNSNQRSRIRDHQRSRDAEYYEERFHPGSFNNYQRTDNLSNGHIHRNRQVLNDPFDDFFRGLGPGFSLFEDRQSFFPNEGQRMQRRRIQGHPNDDLFLNFSPFFEDFGQSFQPRRRNPGIIDLMPSINFFLDNGIRRTSNRRRRDQNLLEMFFGRNGGFDAFNSDPFHEFFNARGSRGLDIGQILSQLSMMSSAQQGQQAHPGNRSRMKDVRMTSAIIAENQTCTVCQEDFKLGETTKKLPCEHYFHDECISPWLQSQNTCPMCRATI